IYNVEMNKPTSDYIGLFGCAGGKIRNLGIEDVNISGHSYIGGLAGINYGTITGCYATGKVTGTGNYVGGLAGYRDLGQVNKYLLASHCIGPNQEKLFLWSSNDGRNWNLLNGGASYVAPEYVIRDPSIFYHTDGKYYVAYTNNDNNNVPHDFRGTRFGIASSPDLITWTHVAWVDANLAGRYPRTWAPEFVRASDLINSADSNIYIFGAISGIIDGNTTGLSYIKATTADLSTWSSPVGLPLYPTGAFTGGAAIDPYIVTKPNDPNFYLFYKNNTLGYICLATSLSLTGPYTTIKTGDWAGWKANATPAITTNIEGPCIKWLGGTSWRMYFQSDVGAMYYSESTDNWATWTAPVLCTDNQSSLTIGHGTVIEYPVVDQTINDGTITNCYATEAVTGSNYVGGLVGINKDGTIGNCYTMGAVSGDNYVGGLVGYKLGGSVVSSFWDTQTSGKTTSAGGTDKTTAEMKTLSTFTSVGWDFVDTWNIGENQTYPFLRKHSISDLNYDDIVNFVDFALFAENWLAGQ
ncbi:MAG: GLUG motif-containing protein, partial [Sedimentisphaerales bacterium]